MPSLHWHEYLLILSFFAAIAGLLLLVDTTEADETEAEVTDRVLLLMTFTYWMVHCLAVAAQKMISPDLDALAPGMEMLTMSIKLTGVISYLLTFTCVLSLPLHRVSIRQTE